MAKKKEKTISFDFQFGIPEIIPSKQKSDEETISIKAFNKTVSDKLKKNRDELDQFPTSYEVFIYIQQFFVSKKEYRRRDVDNMAKTMLDLLVENGFIEDDHQVRTLFVHKKIESSVPQNFAYLALKRLKNDNDVSLVKIAGYQRAKEFYRSLI